MSWHPILLASVVIAGCLMSACRDTTPTSPGLLTERGSSQQSQPPLPSGPISSRPAPPPTDPATPPPTSGSCDATKAQFALGNTASDELLERARVAAGAGSARFLRPNDRITMEFLGSRLNVSLDKLEIVRSVVCG